MLNNGTKVQLKEGTIIQPWFELGKQYRGIVISHVDGNDIVQLNEPVMFDGSPMRNFSFQSISLEVIPKVHPEACTCDECAAIRFAFCGYED